MPDLAQVTGRVSAWLLELARLRAGRVLPVPGGIAVLHDAFPDAYDHNRLVLIDAAADGACDGASDAAADGAAVVAAAEQVLGSAGRSHRLVEVLSEPTARAVGPALLAAGYRQEDGLLMLWEPGAVPDRGGDDLGSIVELDVDERAVVAEAGWLQEEPHQAAAVSRQLGQRIRTVSGAAAPTFLGIRDGTGAVVARADLYLRDGVGQVEEVLTAVPFRGRGLARRLVLAAGRRAVRQGTEIVFLQADAHDWPQVLYRRLGYRDLARTSSFHLDVPGPQPG